jgi:adenine phosphoribosyltransferase
MRSGKTLEAARPWRKIAGMIDSLKRLIREIPDFPKKGILFRDITPLLADPSGIALAVELLANPFRGKNIDLVVGAESRGFIFGTAVACCLSAGFVLVRKPGKLPHKKVSMTYDLEYGTDTLEMHEDSILKDQRVLIVDDLLATGGTMKACCELVEGIGGKVVGLAVLIELAGLRGRDRLAEHKIHSVLQYD